MLRAMTNRVNENIYTLLSPGGGRGQASLRGLRGFTHLYSRCYLTHPKYMKSPKQMGATVLRWSDSKTLLKAEGVSCGNTKGRWFQTTRVKKKYFWTRNGNVGRWSPHSFPSRFTCYFPQAESSGSRNVYSDSRVTIGAGQ